MFLRRGALGLLAGVLLVSCAGVTDPKDDDDPPNEPDEIHYYLSLRTMCGDGSGSRPAYIKVGVFDLNSRQRLILGNTLPQDGWFTSTLAFEGSDFVRIEFYDPENDRAIFWVTDISPGTHPHMFVTSPSDFRRNSASLFGMGRCGAYTYTDGAWGP